MMWDGDGWWILMWAWMALFWIVVIGAAFWFVSTLRTRDGGGGAREMLRGRLARGEIDVDEFGQREAALERTAGGRVLPARGLIIAGAIALAVFIVVPAIVISSGGWDMGHMHGRGRNTSGSAAVQGGSQANVRIEGFAFDPGNLQVAPGATVTWTNEDSAQHDATARDADWKTERLSKGERDTLTFDSPGDYDYYCSIHPSMKARLVGR